jgi:hypothetical protein
VKNSRAKLDRRTKRREGKLTCRLPGPRRQCSKQTNSDGTNGTVRKLSEATCSITHSSHPSLWNSGQPMPAPVFYPH